VIPRLWNHAKKDDTADFDNAVRVEMEREGEREREGVCVSDRERGIKREREGAREQETVFPQSPLYVRGVGAR